MFGSLRKRAPPWAIKDEPKEIDSTERQPFNLALLTKTNAEPGGLLAQSADSALQARLKGVPLGMGDAFLFFQVASPDTDERMLVQPDAKFYLTCCVRAQLPNAHNVAGVPRGASS